MNKFFKKKIEFDNKYNTLFFFISVFILCFLLIYSMKSPCVCEECVCDNKAQTYSYSINYKSINNELNIIVYKDNNKYLVSYGDDTYYIDNINIYKKDITGNYELYFNNIIDGIDNNMLIIDYLIDNGNTISNDSINIKNDNYEINYVIDYNNGTNIDINVK